MGSSKPKSSQTKTQQSISSFFTPKSTVTGPSQTQPLAAQKPPSQEINGTGEIYDANSTNEEPVRSTATSKRPLAEDSTGGNGGLAERPAKRPKEDNEVTRKANPSPRTEKYLYSSSQHVSTTDAILEEEDGALTAAQKDQLHKKFVKKLGHPDSIAQIKRRRFGEEIEAVEGEDGEEDEEEVRPAKTKAKGTKTGKLTPMEMQILDIKRKNMDTILIIEVGYKFKFFGEDARTAAKELGIVCIPGKFRYDEHPSEAHLDRFASASFPTHRLSVHAKRLVQAGHKVGVVRQMETAALKKAGTNRNTTFERKLTNVYTKGTYIEDIDGLEQPADGPSGGAPATGYLLCFTESKANGWGTDEKVEVGILAVQPATGDIIYDTFEDGFMRNEIETRLLHLAPCEFLIVGELTKATDKLVQHLSGSSSNVFGDKIRVERISKSKTMAAQAHSHVTSFYADRVKKNLDADKDQDLLDRVLNLEESITVCLSAMITHLTEYGLQHVFDLTKYFQSFSVRSQMLLNGNTLTSLEIYHNQTDYSEKGSLFWTLDKTHTRFGQRLLRKWVGRPLLDKGRLEERVEAVEELKDGHQTPRVDKLTYVLKNIKSDLERSLIRIYYGKCTRPEFLTVMQTLQKLSMEYTNASYCEAGFKSSIINSAISSLPLIGDIVISFLEKINAEAARKDDKYAFFRSEEETEAIANHKLGIAAVEHDLDLHRAAAKSKLESKTEVVYNTTAGIEYLIEVSNTNLKRVPASWIKISGTKKVSRFHTPEVIKMLRERDQHKESLSAACDDAFSALLADISTHYAVFRDCISHLATLDCLLSLATVASYPGYCKPTFLPPSIPTTIDVHGARHPMVEQLVSSYIANSTALSTSPDSTRALLITGPNMGGKSSYVRSLAILCIMAQIGSFVPADSATLSLLESIHVRMGASDNLFNNQSTFQVELSETSEILKTAGPRSLVILDELGRGTSTHDGVAIAGSVLDYVVRDLRCLCLFITHYQSLSTIARGFEKGGELKNVHMKFTAENTENSGDEEVTFLYEVGEGVAHRSYGLNVARLARVPKSVLDVAAIKSREMEQNVMQKKLTGISKLMEDVLWKKSDMLSQLIVGIEQL
ncbi:DNA mismatch repair protein-like protein msh3 [Bisporella sp. PMI_857]|nr:DNA mismatch repair protein-like protein msh3 [Bisporella sp. PMI_857]